MPNHTPSPSQSPCPDCKGRGNIVVPCNDWGGEELHPCTTCLREGVIENDPLKQASKRLREFRGRLTWTIDNEHPELEDDLWFFEAREWLNDAIRDIEKAGTQ